MAIRTRTATFTRPADTTAYAANDLVSTSSTSNAAAPMVFAGARGTLKRVILVKSTNTTSNSALKLFLYSSDPSGALTDNAALAQAQAANLIGVVSIATAVVGQGAAGDVALSYAQSDNILAAGSQIPIDVAFGQAGPGNLGSRDGNIYGLLVATAAYAPGSGEVFTVALHIEPDYP